jgi:hypothetical protein
MDQTERQTVEEAAERVRTLNWRSREEMASESAEEREEGIRLAALLAIIEKQDAAFEALDTTFLAMRDRVSGYGRYRSDFRPLAGQRMFEQGASVFEWCATQSRLARAGERLLDPPTPDEAAEMRAARAREVEAEEV